MDSRSNKSFRIMKLYHSLSNGDSINKISYCEEMNCDERTFDRDIQELRNFLSELSKNQTLFYDKAQNLYKLKIMERTSIDECQYKFLLKHLFEMSVLNQNEMNQLLEALALNTENPVKFKAYKDLCMEKYKAPIHAKEVLCLHNDLMKAIDDKRVIQIRYTKMNHEIVKHSLIPCTIRHDLGYLYLIAYIEGKTHKYPAYFRLDRIDEVGVIERQTKEQEELVAYFMNRYNKALTLMFAGEYLKIIAWCQDDFYPYVHDFFEKVEVLEMKDGKKKIEISSFSEGFIKWIVAQPVEFIQVIKPETMKKMILDHAKKLQDTYNVSTS